MDILFDRNVEPRYQQALDREPWTTVDHCGNHFPQDAQNTPDEKIADFAETNGWVLFTRDRPFFGRAQTRNCGLLLLDKSRNPSASDVVLAVERISNAYTDHDNIRESIPGNWI